MQAAVIKSPGTKPPTLSNNLTGEAREMDRMAEEKTKQAEAAVVNAVKTAKNAAANPTTTNIKKADVAEKKATVAIENAKKANKPTMFFGGFLGRRQQTRGNLVKQFGESSKKVAAFNKTTKRLGERRKGMADRLDAIRRFRLGRQSVRKTRRAETGKLREQFKKNRQALFDKLPAGKNRKEAIKKLAANYKASTKNLKRKSADKVKEMMKTRRGVMQELKKARQNAKEEERKGKKKLREAKKKVSNVKKVTEVLKKNLK